MIKTLGYVFLLNLLSFGTAPKPKPAVFTGPPTKRGCAADEVLEAQIRADPRRGTRLDEIEAHTQRYVTEMAERRRLGRVPARILTIPCKVHVVWRTAAEKLSEAMVQAQIDVLNEDFRRTNADADSTWPQAADTGFQFTLDEIIYKQTTVDQFGTNDGMKFDNQGGSNIIEPTKFLNMWTCNIGGGILGYAQFPGGSASTDGIVMGYQYFGRNTPNGGDFNLGRTATHEVGHWMNLRHIWGDGNCGADDFVSDTPLSDASNFGCPTTHSSCNTLDMVQNYMDYTDDSCMNLFTQGQTDRMWAIFADGGFRDSFNTPCVVENCASCVDGNENSCATCNTGYWDENSDGTCSPIVCQAANCNACSVDPNTCGVCNTGFSLASSGACVACAVDNCKSCETANVCAVCNSGFSSDGQGGCEFVLSYCSSAAGSALDSILESLTFGGITYSNSNCGTYTDATTNLATVTAGDSVSLTWRQGTCSGDYGKESVVWIDWNRDGDFSDAGEEVGRNVATTASSTKTVSVTVPTDAVTGRNVRMRVVVAEVDFDRAAFCGGYSYGETVDFSVVVEDNCPGPVTCSQNSDCPSSADVCQQAVCSNPGTGCSTCGFTVPDSNCCSVTTNPTCDDSDACTVDSCNSNQCSNTFSTSLCTCAQNSDCSVTDVCQQAVCNNPGTTSSTCGSTVPDSNCCSVTTNPTCDDNDACTVDSCVNNQCSNVFSTTLCPVACFSNSDCSSSSDKCVTAQCLNAGTSSASCSTTSLTDCTTVSFGTFIYGLLGQSCNQACQFKGLSHDLAATIAANTETNCRELMDAFGLTDRNGSFGIGRHRRGCSYRPDRESWLIGSREANAGSANSSIERMCGCQ